VYHVLSKTDETKQRYMIKTRGKINTQHHKAEQNYSIRIGKIKVNQPHYRPGGAHRVPGS